MKDVLKKVKSSTSVVHKNELKWPTIRHPKIISQQYLQTKKPNILPIHDVNHNIPEKIVIHFVNSAYRGSVMPLKVVNDPKIHKRLI